MKGFSAWPGKIAIPPDGMKRPAMRKMMHCVFFFGTHDYGWILESDLKPYLEFKKTLTSNKKSASFLKAINEMEDFLQGGGKKATGATGGSRQSSGDDAEYEKDAEFDALFKKKTGKTPVGAKGVKRASPLAKPDSAKKARLKASNGKKTGNRSFLGSEERELSPPPMGNHFPKKSASAAVSSLLDRPSALQRPASPSFDVSASSQTLKEKDIQPSSLKFGFLGLGIMGGGIVKNLLNSGHSVSVWNRTSEKCDEFVKAGALKALTPADVILDSDVTFSCVSDPQAAKDMVFGNCGVLTEISGNKAYVEMTGIDGDTSEDIAEAICLKGGRYLEAQVQGSKQQANDGTLVILAAGDRTLFDDCQSCFKAMGKNSFYLGEVGTASKMNLVLQLMSGVTLAGLAEGMALADRAGLQQKDVLEVLELTGLSCPLIIRKGKAIIEGGFPTNHPLQHMQKDLKLSLNLGDQLEQPLPLTASANEVFKHAKRLGYGDHDTSAVYIRARF
eukprot:TRINITY_DN321_c0_g1_i1.p1 TRINITY_DN321_c0_g1~~TRINITY_DN321_c0_g1_i1.p1  ORF type:complete len:503 (-),score=196.60 TRINITY_DN321_c0_g1_i1:246-1754(-)